MVCFHHFLYYYLFVFKLGLTFRFGISYYIYVNYAQNVLMVCFLNYEFTQLPLSTIITFFRIVKKSQMFLLL